MNAAVFAHPPQVVAQQVHNHHVLGPVLGARPQHGGTGPVFFRRLPARARPLDWPGLNQALLDAQEALRRGASDHELAEVRERRNRLRDLTMGWRKARANSVVPKALVELIPLAALAPFAEVRPQLLTALGELVAGAS